MSVESPIDTNFMMLLIPNILTSFNSKESAVSKKYLIVAVGLIVTEILRVKVSRRLYCEKHESPYDMKRAYVCVCVCSFVNQQGNSYLSL